MTTRLLLWGHLLTVATNDDVNILDSAFVLTDAKLNFLASFASPVAAPEGDHADLLRLRTPEDLRKVWDEAGVWQDAARDGMAISLVDYHLSLAIKDLLDENGLYPEDVEITVVGRNTEQLMRIIEGQMPQTFAYVKREALNAASLVDAFRYFVPSVFGAKGEAFLDRQQPHRATEYVEAEIKALTLLMHRVPAAERFVPGATGTELQSV